MGYFMTNKKEYQEYLIEEQGYEEEVVKRMPLNELKDLYEHYHEDYG